MVHFPKWEVLFPIYTDMDNNKTTVGDMIDNLYLLYRSTQLAHKVLDIAGEDYELRIKLLEMEVADFNTIYQ